MSLRIPDGRFTSRLKAGALSPGPVEVALIALEILLGASRTPAFRWQSASNLRASLFAWRMTPVYKSRLALYGHQRPAKYVRFSLLTGSID